jgi:hypothetical protein
VGAWGLYSTAQYTQTTTNASSFRFGNRFAVNSQAYYQLRTGGIRLIPNLGVQYQYAAANQYEHAMLEQSGGYHLNIAGGLDIRSGKYTAGVSLQLPVLQRYADGQTNLQHIALVHINYAW